MKKILNKNQMAVLNGLARKMFSNSFVERTASVLYTLFQTLSLKLGLRRRYLFTRHNKLRLRYLTGFAVFIMTAMMVVTLVSQNSSALPSMTSIAALEPAAGYEGNIQEFGDLIDGGLFGQLALTTPLSPIEDVPEALPLDREIVIKPGDALGVVMEKQGVGGAEASTVIAAIKDHYDPRRIKAGQKIEMHFDAAEDDTQRFREMKIKLDPLKTLVVARAGDDFKSQLQEKEVKKVIKAKQAQVENSLYGSAAKAGIPQGVVAEAIRIYSWNVDFQRDIQPKDKLEVLYESFETDTGHVAKNGNILYAKLTLGDREIPLYRYTTADGRTDYFQPDGRSIKRTLMKTPINGARMSSGFGQRRHPVLGYNKMHKGLDFAAPTGTPIFAAGDGVVEHAGWFSSYGKYVRIRHNSKLKTAYAHMSKISSEVKPGSRVKQGDVIGYVGTTGRSTGPHLHYEVIADGRQVNPRSVNLPTGEELVGKELTAFKSEMSKTRRQFASALQGTEVADSGERRRFFFN